MRVPRGAEPMRAALRAPVEPARLEVVRRRGVEIVFHHGPVPALGAEPLTAVELEFRDLIAGDQIGDRVEVRREFHEWSERVRRAWEAENVIWFHGYADGKPVWRRERPPRDVEPPKAASRSGTSIELPRCKLRTKEERDHA